MNKETFINLFKDEINDYIVNGKRYVNLDSAATTPPLKAVQDGVDDYLVSYGSVHRGAGEKSKVSTDIYEKSRQVIKDFVGAPTGSYVIFSGNTTGGMNILAHFFSHLDGKVAVSSIEHSSSWLPWIKAEGERSLNSRMVTSLNDMGFVNDLIQKNGNSQVLRYCLNGKGEFDLKQIEKLLRENKIKVFVLTASSNLTGYCPDIQKIGKLVHKYEAYYVVDGCQYIQHHSINMSEMGIDFLVASGHKFYAPYGGGFVVGPKIFLDQFLPYQIGGGNLPYITSDGEFLRYENNLAHDPGTPNAVGAVSMAAALSELKRIGINNIEKYETGLTRQAYDGLAKIKNVKLLVNGKQLTTVIPFIIDGIDSEAVAEKLNNDFGIGVRAGNFCVYHVVRDLLKITPEQEKAIIRDVKRGETGNMPGVVRASFSICNDSEDVTRFIGAVEEIAQRKNKK
ncbi:MAG: aminotransferase class V-fold PLP-dependent enzyme [Candidatus Nomurabacteria bacterium]|jgi:cysteine desulfurase|nr:aminotransferase class V-fold PLP-dependent enzyme [Candidatus Nomurabacteria bacterium]